MAIEIFKFIKRNNFIKKFVTFRTGGARFNNRVADGKVTQADMEDLAAGWPELREVCDDFFELYLKDKK